MGTLSHDHGVILMPLALSRTQDDKGRVRWTLFGVSEQGPAKAFWKSFTEHAAAPGRQRAGLPVSFVADRIQGSGGNPPTICLKAGFESCPRASPSVDCWHEEPLPEWALATGIA